MKDQYVYLMGRGLYVNLTNRCSNRCDFCVRNYDVDPAKKHGFAGYDLWLDHEPSAQEVIDRARAVLDAHPEVEEVVFCGYGEPTYRVEQLCAVADFAHERGLKTRLNTNGQGNAINGRDITDDIVSHIDEIGVSLNAADAEKYDAVCHSEWGERGFDLMLAFAEECAEKGGSVSLSVVDIIGREEIAKARTIAEKIGAKLRVRKMIDG